MLHRCTSECPGIEPKLTADRANDALKTQLARHPTKPINAYTNSIVYFKYGGYIIRK